MILHCLYDVVFALIIALQQRLSLHSVQKILLRQERQSNMLQQLRQVLRSLLRVEVDPGDDALEHLLLAGHGDGVAGNELSHLVLGETVELVTLKHLREVSLNVGLGAENNIVINNIYLIYDYYSSRDYCKVISF